MKTIWDFIQGAWFSLVVMAIFAGVVWSTATVAQVIGPVWALIGVIALACGLFNVAMKRFG